MMGMAACMEAEISPCMGHNRHISVVGEMHAWKHIP